MTIETGAAICETGDNQGDYLISTSALRNGAMGRLIGEEVVSGVQGFTMNGCECHQINLVLKYFTTHLGCPTKINPGQRNGSDAPTKASTGSTAGRGQTVSRSALQNYFATEMRATENPAGGRLEMAMVQTLSVRSSVIQE